MIAPGARTPTGPSGAGTGGTCTAFASPPTQALPRPPVHQVSPVLILLVLGIHAPIALAMHASSTLATAHTMLTILTLVWVLAAARTPGPLITMAAYVTGCEVLWRQTFAAVPWEISKYLLVLTFAVGIFRFVRRLERWGTVALFLAMLVPASVIPVVKLGFIAAVDPLSFNLGGLIALAIGVLFLSRLAGPWPSVTPALWAFVAPVLGIATLAADSVRRLGASDFFNDSNFKSSGGYGPNQVSAVLGLGALFLILLAIRDDRLSLRLTALTLALWFTAQAMLTFSRGGVVNLVVALLFAIPHLLRRRDTAARLALVCLVVGLLGALVILPRLDTFTGGALETRFSRSHEAERRADLMAKDYETFTEHPGLGVGVGQSEYYRIERRLIASHTEYTRMLAEHGLLGIVALGCLLVMAINAYRGQRTPFGHAWTASLVAWTALELSHSSTRLAAVAFVFALAAFTIDDDPDPEPDTHPAPIPPPVGRRR